jgi:uncharacterized protein
VDYSLTHKKKRKKSIMGLVADYQKIGVVGIYNSGKTVFLTSLINHLLHHDSGDFKISPSAFDRKLARLPLIGKAFPRGPLVIKKAHPLPLKEAQAPFDYDRFRDDLMRNGIWPEKTCDTSHYRIKFQLSSRWLRELCLHFFDFPGERIADAAIAVLNFDQWSDHTLKRVETDAGYRDLAREFLDLQVGPLKDKNELLHQYKIALARFRRNFRPLITPSSFVLNSAGTLIDSHQPPETMIQNRYCGLGPDCEFVPLSQTLRRAHPGLAEEFKSAFEQYKNRIVLPALNHLRSCDRLIVLVDLPTILNSGPLMANDVHDITRDLLDFCRPGKNILEKLYALSGLPFLLRRMALESLANTRITRIAFVASKCDLVHEQDRDHLLLLLKELIANLPEIHPGVETNFYSCCAAQSTVSDPHSHALIGTPEFTPIGSAPQFVEEKLIQVSRVPAHFPDHWEPGDFCFPDFKPKRFPGLKTRPPKQMGLDKVFSFVVGSNITD